MNALTSLAAPLFNQTPHLHHEHDDHDDDNQRQQSQSQKQINPMVKAKKSISLENYIDFFHSRDSRFFTVGHIRQIIAIQGFKKGGNKRQEIEEAVAAMELIDPARSTLNEKVSPDALTTVEEATRDFATLNWKECCITSIRTISPLMNKAPVDPFKHVTKPSTRKAKKRSVSALSVFSSVNSRVSESGLNESDSVSGSSMLTVSATSSSNNADGLILLSLPEEAQKNGVEEKQFSRKRKSIKRILLA